MFDAEGRFRGYQGITRDVTRKVRDERLRTLDRGVQTPAEVISVMCECGRGGCLERFDVPVSALDETAAGVGWFVVATGHEPKDERPLHRAAGYTVVGPKPVESPPLPPVAPRFAT